MTSSIEKARRWLLLRLVGSSSLIVNRAAVSAAFATDEPRRSIGPDPAAPPDSPGPLTTDNVGALMHPRTAHEVAASITPVSYAYAANDIRRYGGDPNGLKDNAVAFRSLFEVMLQAGGGSAILPPGTYRLESSVVVTLTNASPPNGIAHGLTLYGYGVVIDFMGRGYAFDFLSPNTSATFYQPQIVLFGINFNGTILSSGAIRTSNLSSGRYYDVYGREFRAGAAFTLRNSSSWSENTRFIGCGAINCKTGIVFTVEGGNGSYARTRVEHFFGAGISDYWFDVGPGCAVYDSLFTHIAGNFGALAYFGIGAPGTGADMTSTVIDGIDCERNGGRPGQGIIRLRDYPQTSGNARRPKIINLGMYSGYTGSGFIPTWVDSRGERIVGPEAAQLQAFNCETPIVSNQGQSKLWESNYGVGGALCNAATCSSSLATCVLTGFKEPIIGRIVCSRTGALACISVQDSMLGLSTSGSMTLVGLPAEVIPASARSTPCVVQNGGVSVLGMASISANGKIIFAVPASNGATSNEFIDTGVKGLIAGTSLCFNL